MKIWGSALTEWLAESSEKGEEVIDTPDEEGQPEQCQWPPMAGDTKEDFGHLSLGCSGRAVVFSFTPAFCSAMAMSMV